MAPVKAVGEMHASAPSPRSHVSVALGGADSCASAEAVEVSLKTDQNQYKPHKNEVRDRTEQAAAYLTWGVWYQPDENCAPRTNVEALSVKGSHSTIALRTG